MTRSFRPAVMPLEDRAMLSGLVRGVEPLTGAVIASKQKPVQQIPLLQGGFKGHYSFFSGSAMSSNFSLEVDGTGKMGGTRLFMVGLVQRAPVPWQRLPQSVWMDSLQMSLHNSNKSGVLTLAVVGGLSVQSSGADDVVTGNLQTIFAARSFKAADWASASLTVVLGPSSTGPGFASGKATITIAPK
jgi:hypothetical protein